MSDLITTTQDNFRGQCIDLYVGMRSMLDTIAERARARTAARPPPSTWASCSWSR